MHPVSVLYVGKLSDEEDFQLLRELLGPSFVAQYNFESALHDQLSATPDLSISSLSFLLGPAYPNGPAIRRGQPGKRKDHQFLGFINIPLLRESTLFLSVATALMKRWLKGEHTDIILLATSYTPVTLACRWFSVLLGAKLVLTLTDLSGFSYRSSRVAKMSILKRVLIGSYRRLAAWTEASADAYVLFSSEMVHRVNIREAPRLVMEGMFNPKNIAHSPRVALSRSIIAHAGTLDRQYGVEHLLNVFAKLPGDQIELWLIGSGDMTDEIERRAVLDPRIHFLGFLPRDEVFELLCQARLLVNLRDPEEEFTKYSFPSKLFEYMMTSVPVASTRLKGIPQAYFDFILPVDTMDPAETSEQLLDILCQDTESLLSRGRAGRQFVLEKKCPQVQAGLVADFLRTL